MPRNKDVLWEYITQEGRKVRCKFCHEVFVGGVTRMRYHFAKTKSKDIRPCKSVPDPVREIALKGVQELRSKSKRHKALAFPKSTSSSLGSILQSGALKVVGPQAYDLSPKPIRYVSKKAARKEADNAIVRCIVSDNLPFSLLKSTEFREACAAVANAGPGYEPPSSELAWTRLLGVLKDEVAVYVNSIQQTWEKSGCTLLLDSCIEGRNLSYLNLLAASPKGVIHLKSLCTVGHATDVQYVFDFVSSVIEEIGSHNVVQFLSDGSVFYASVGNMIEQKYPNIFTINCAAHCINLMFKELDVLDHISPILEGAKKIFNFVYKYQQMLNLVKADWKKHTASRLSTNFIYLKSILKEEGALREMIATTEWRDFPQAKSVEGLEVQNLIQENIFWECGKQLMHAIGSLVKVFRMVEGDGSTSGYIYEAMHKAKEAIKECYRADSGKYLPFWNIIDDKWSKLLHCDIHAAAAYLNPHLFHDGRVKLDSEIKVGLEKVVQRMVLNNDDRMKIAAELRDYHSLDPHIFGLMAIDSLHVSHPRIWWDMWGSSVPILQSMAIKILSQPCSFSARHKNYGALESTYTSKTEQADPIRMQDLLYVRMNMHLMKAISKTKNIDSKLIDVDKNDLFPDELEGCDTNEGRENTANEGEEEEEEEEEEESEDEVGTQSEANGFSFTGLL